MLETEFYKGLNFLPLINQHADTQMCIKQSRVLLFPVPTASDPYMSRALDMGVSLNYQVRLHLNEDVEIKQNQTRCCTPFLFTPVNCITNIKCCFPNPNSCKKLQDIEYHFVFLPHPQFHFSFHFCVLRFDLSCIPQSAKERDKKFSSCISMFITK